MKTRFLPVALATVVLTLSACGGSGAPPSLKANFRRPYGRVQIHDARVYPHGQMVKDEEPTT